MPTPLDQPVKEGAMRRTKPPKGQKTVRDFSVRLLLVAATLAISLMGSLGTAHAVPFNLPFLGSSGGGNSVPPASGAGQVEVFGVTWKFDRPPTRGVDSIGIVPISDFCAINIDPQSRTVDPSSRTEALVFRMTPAITFPTIIIPIGPCAVAPATAVWDIYTTTRRGTDKTRVEFFSNRGSNSLEWKQTTYSGVGGTVFIDRVATGLVLSVHN